jgi:4-hydroxybenzoate polyprenyltransferase
MSNLVKNLFTTLRIKEVLLMTGFSIIGIFFIESSLLNKPKVLFYSCICMPIFVLNIYHLNFYADFEEDLKSSRIKKLVYFSKKYYLLSFFITTILLTVVYISFSLTLMLVYHIILFLWIMYYLRPFRLKAKLFLGTLVHFFAGILHFQLGYLAFDSLNLYSLLISIFFALLLSIGHINHEAIDYENDLLTGIKTTTVRLGLKTNKLILVCIMLVAMVYWSFLLFNNVIFFFSFIIFILPFLPLIFYMIFFSEPNPLVFQKISRTVFLVAGLIFLTHKFFSK